VRKEDMNKLVMNFLVTEVWLFSMDKLSKFSGHVERVDV